MQRLHWTLLAGLGVILAGATKARADTELTLKGVHLCCPACVKAVAAIIKEVDGAKAACDTKKKTVTITAPDDKTAQKAVDALAAGGFHGDSDSKDVKVKDESGIPEGKDKTLTLTGACNCCGACCKAIK